jgi:hypothetical protein
MTPVVVSMMERGTVVAGRRRAEKAKPEHPRRLLASTLLALGAIGTGVAWLFLVRAAVAFGQVARDGRSAAWWLCGVATVGAAVCLLLGFVLLSRLWSHLQVRRAPRPAPGGRRRR